MSEKQPLINDLIQQISSKNYIRCKVNTKYYRKHCPYIHNAICQQVYFGYR